MRTKTEEDGCVTSKDIIGDTGKHASQRDRGLKL